MVMAGQEDLVIGGGTEMMSLPKKGLLPMGANNAHLQEIHPQSHQGVCADAIASIEGIDREALDAHAAESQRRAAVAITEGRFDRSLVPVLNLDGTVALDHEEFPRPGTTAESLAALAPSFPAVADYRLAEDVPDVPRAHQPEVPRPRDRSTSTTPATPRASSTAPPPCSTPARTT